MRPSFFILLYDLPAFLMDREVDCPIDLEAIIFRINQTVDQLVSIYDVECSILDVLWIFLN